MFMTNYWETNHRGHGLLHRLNTARVLVAGDVMLDRYWQGSTLRISPEAPVPVVKVEKTEERPGGAGNVALNVAALGGQAILLGLTGADAAGDTLQAQLTSTGVRCEFQRVRGAATIIKLTQVATYSS